MRSTLKKLCWLLLTFLTTLTPVGTAYGDEPAQAAGSENKSEAIQENAPVTIVTWNIQVGSNKGPFMNGWPKRKPALIAALKSAHPDVFCSQEGRLEQLQYVDKNFPGWGRVGVGRDDGKNGGEFCAIYFNKKRLELTKSGTFWLSDTPDSPKKTWDGVYKRICTHAQFKDKINGTKFVVLSTHFPVDESVSEKAAKLVATKINQLYENLPIFLCGDFNCEPSSAAWKAFGTAYLEPIDEKHTKTWMMNGKPVACLDAIFKNEDIRVVEQKVLNKKYNKIYPSDHFGLLVKAYIPDMN